MSYANNAWSTAMCKQLYGIPLVCKLEIFGLTLGIYIAKYFSVLLYCALARDSNYILHTLTAVFRVNLVVILTWL